MSISQEELDSAYAVDADRLNDQLRSSPSPPMLALEPNELAQLADDFDSALAEGLAEQALEAFLDHEG